MLRKYATLIAFSSLLATSVFAQGLNTRAAKNDWEEINFEFNSAVLSDGYPSLLRLADLLSKNPGYHVRVEGNTDNLGSRRYNERLALQRAEEVKRFLVKYGANAGQIETVSRGKANPEVPGYKNRYSKTDVARWMNRRVVLTVTDQNGKVVGDGGINEAINAMPQAQAPCCEDILKRLDKLDDIARMLHDLTDQNANLKQQLDQLKQQQAALEDRINGLPKPLNEQQTSEVVTRQIEAARTPRWSLLGLNVGADDRGGVTFSGKGRYFAPFKDHFAVQAQGEYLYFTGQREGQFDLGLVNRIGRFQGGLFGSVKHVNLHGYGAGGNLGQASAMFDWLFGDGRIGLFGTKAFLNNAVLGRSNLVLADGTIAPNLYSEYFLHVVDQVGISTTLGLMGNTYLEGNIGYLKSAAHADRAGGTVRFVFPIRDRFAFTAEGGINETEMPGRGTNGRAVFGIQWGNLLRPKEFASSNYPVPMDVPRIRWELVNRVVKKGVAPPIADAGPDQIGVPAGTITLNGSNSRDPNGLALTYHWVQEAGPSVALSDPNASVATFQAQPDQTYAFRLTVTNTDNQSASARTRVSTLAPQKVNILFFNANPTQINAGQSATLSYQVQNATSVTISGIGEVNPANGNLPISPTTTTTYTLTATNANGSQNATATITVMTPQPQVLTCSATPMSIMAGESATILYATQGATTVTVNNGVGNVQPSGTFVVSPTTTTTYTVTATNQFASATCNVTVQVTGGGAPRVVSFTASPTSVAAGGMSTLSWQVDNAETVTITPNVGTVQLSGSQSVTVAQTTTYTLTATNKTGQTTGQATVTVTGGAASPTITSFTASPATSPSPGAPVVLTCLSSNATTVTINGAGALNSSGQVTVNPTTNTTYTCTAAGGAGTKPATATVTVPVTQPTGQPPIIVIGGQGLTCSGPGVLQGSNNGTVLCQTLARTVVLDFSGSSSPTGNTPLAFNLSVENQGSSIIGGSTSTPTVQLSGDVGDYFFNLVVTDSKGLQSTARFDIQFISTKQE